jgi:hypothetical protein
MTFHSRKRELALLSRLCSSSRAELQILYGRRRIGKTRLLTHWMGQQESSLRVLYWVAEPSSSTEQLRAFSQALYRFSSPDFPVPVDFQYGSWDQVWDVLAQLARKERFVLIWDEFTYMLQADPSIAGKLQNAWDHVLSRTKLFFILTGSHLGMLHRHVLSHQAPLYGRASAHLRLEPLPFGVMKEFFPEYGADERVALYSIFGGVPAYWERIDPSVSVAENIRRQLLTPGNLMHDEPRLLLQDFVSEIHHYTSLLRGIAKNARTQKELSIFTGLPSGHVSKYLSVLREARFVERRIPVTSDERSRLGRYHLTDPYLRFYYRFLSERQSLLALGIQDQCLAEIRRHLRDYIGTHTWEELSREWVLRAGTRGKIPFLVDRVGSIWNAKAQVDVAGINSMEKTILLGECKWSPRKQRRAVLDTLAGKVAGVLPAGGKWDVLCMGFFRQGMHRVPDRLDIADSDTIRHVHPPGCVTLEELDRDLSEWSE